MKTSLAACMAILVLTASRLPAAAPTGSWEEAPEASPVFLVYYFHDHLRCETCLSMEAMAVETVNYDFMDEVDQGILAPRTVDVQDEGNERFVQEFDLNGPTLVLVEQDDAGGCSAMGEPGPDLGARRPTRRLPEVCA